MSRLKILMADDQQIEIEEVRRALKDMDHEVAAVAVFDEATKLAQNEAYDIAVVDLGWYGDKSLKKQLSQEDIAAAGWKILNLVKANLGGSFLSLAALRAIGTITLLDLKYLGKLLPSLFHKS